MAKLIRYWILTLLGVFAISIYPIYMGCSVLYYMITEGTVFEENFPKYIIPYTPIALSIIVAVIIMPLVIKYIKKFSVLIVSLFSVAVFFVAELIFETKVIVTSTVTSTLESWQMFMCYIPPVSYKTRTWKTVDVLIGDYSPTFKLHFYLISIVLIIAIINSLYGFAKIIYTSDRSRCKTLVIQSICTSIFLVLCILACFTAFFRDGEITVSFLSAILMSLFFVMLGVTSGTYVFSFLIGWKKHISVLISSLVASIITFTMYVGEMFLLNGNLYRFGKGFVFEGLSGIILAPIDFFVILLSGCVCFGICYLINFKKTNT
ncbi:MAG: hypothetical protein J1E41_01055 [Ruminococcus sp.]|nr:hypothetical protein [Ruminococcus sp.]